MDKRSTEVLFYLQSKYLGQVYNLCVFSPLNTTDTSKAMHFLI